MKIKKLVAQIFLIGVLSVCIQQTGLASTDSDCNNDAAKRFVSEMKFLSSQKIARHILNCITSPVLIINSLSKQDKNLRN